MQDEKYILVDSEESLANLLADLELYEMAAVDTEADSMYHYTTRLCLIQITIGEHHYIVDPLCGLDLAPLFKARAMQTLIFHGADYDLRLLWQTYGFSPKQIFDTMLAAKILGEEHLGLADLVREYFGDELKKENQRADWTTRPLPLEMCEYAIHDTFYLHELCAILVEKLQEAGRMSWLTEQCDALIEHAKHPAPPRKDPWRVTGSAPLSRATAMYRSKRRMLKSLLRAMQRKSVSTFAATTCPTITLPAAFRMNTLFRGSTCRITAIPPSSLAIT